MQSFSSYYESLGPSLSPIASTVDSDPAFVVELCDRVLSVSFPDATPEDLAALMDAAIALVWHGRVPAALLTYRSLEAHRRRFGLESRPGYAELAAAVGDLDRAREQIVALGPPLQLLARVRVLPYEIMALVGRSDATDSSLTLVVPILESIADCVESEKTDDVEFGASMLRLLARYLSLTAARDPRTISLVESIGAVYDTGAVAA